MQLGTISLLTIAFFVLKLTGVIAWSWFWVFSPLIFGAGLVLLVLGIIAIIALLAR